MYFDINNYKGKYVMHCKTEEEARSFCNYLHKAGRKWVSGKSYLGDTYYDDYGMHTAYYFNRGTFGREDVAAQNNYTILEWSDFMNKEFTKADLKTGDVVLRRNGDIEIVNCELGMLICKNGGWNDLSDIKYDLTNVTYGKWNDIVAVRRPIRKADCVFLAFKHKSGELVYERKEVEEMTLEEVCKALGKEIKIVKEKTNG